MFRFSPFSPSKLAPQFAPALLRHAHTLVCGLVAFCWTVTNTPTARATLLSDPSLSNESVSSPDPSPPAVKAQNRALEDILKVQQFFGTTIPGTMKKHKLVFSFSPRAQDVTKKEYVRMPMLLRYGLKDRWELSGGLAPFCPNPFNSGDDHRWGLGEASLGLHYDWGHWGKVFNQVTVGISGRTPLGKPPMALNDYYAHVTPSIATSRPLPWKYTTFFTSFVYDYMTDAPCRAPAPPEVMPRNTFLIIPSVLYKPGEFGASLEYSFRHFEVQQGDTHLGHEIKAGPIWDLPLWRTQSWGLPGKWQVEVSGRVTLEEGQKTDTGVTVRVRWRTKVSELFSKKSYERKPRPN